MFLERFLSDSLREAKAREFEMLKQLKDMSVIEYNTTFNKLVQIRTASGGYL